MVTLEVRDNALRTSQIEEANWAKYMEMESGYKRKTTFFSDFVVAELTGGEKAIKITYTRAVMYWFQNKEYCTELSLVLNHLMWIRYDQGNYSMSKVYQNLWTKLVDKIDKEVTDKEFLEYYYRVTD